jgi:hypothetical protein
MYLYNRPDNNETISYPKKITENTLQVGDVVYVRILSINEEINNLFNLDNNSYTNITSETSITSGYRYNSSCRKNYF